MALDIRTIRDRLVSHAMALGRFETVVAHAPDAIPLTGVHAAVEFDRIAPARRSSGLNVTSVVMTFGVTVYASIDQEPADDIDTAIVEAADALLAAYVAGFTLGGAVRNVDVRGEQGGEGLTAVGDYVAVGGVNARVIMIGVPLVVNGVWSEAA